MTKCQGCGIELQNTNINKVGYTDNLDNLLCTRCFKLSNYGEYSQVDYTNEDYEKLLKTIPKDALIVYTSDILSLNLDRINNYNNILLVITKKDIMPKSLKDEKIINYIKSTTNINNILIISSKKNYNIDTLYKYIYNNSNNQPIYFVGNTNSGKSTLINKLIKNYGSITNNKVTVSMYPSTTLSLVPIKLNDINIIDTPGTIDKSNIINYLDKPSLKKVLPNNEIKPKTCQITGKGSIIIDEFARIDYNTNIRNSIVIYASNNLNIRFNSRKKDNMKNLKEYSFSNINKKDIVIPGLCFIKINNNIDIKIYIIEEVKPYLRNNLI